VTPDPIDVTGSDHTLAVPIPTVDARRPLITTRSTAAVKPKLTFAAKDSAQNANRVGSYRGAVSPAARDIMPLVTLADCSRCDPTEPP
jgi:hypothetical protein